MNITTVNVAELSESTLSAVFESYDYISRDESSLIMYKNTLRTHKDLLCLFHNYKEYDAIIVKL